MINIRFRSCYVLVALVSACLVSCAGRSEEQDKELESEVNNLNSIQSAYIAHTEKTRRLPQQPEDLSKFFPQDVDATKVFTSTRDGEKYVIAWGTDHRKVSGDKPLVIGYEKKGKDGVRMVWTGYGVLEMNDEEFRKADFAAGIKP
jgi:hypothetical protein